VLTAKYGNKDLKILFMAPAKRLTLCFWNKAVTKTFLCNNDTELKKKSLSPA
jgi:hypothetical protein